MAFNLPTDINEFAKFAVWYDCEERFIKDDRSFKHFLVHLLAHSPESYIEHAKNNFGVTDDDLREAMSSAKPGVFMFEKEWISCCKKLGIDPPLPYPRINWDDYWSHYS